MTPAYPECRACGGAMCHEPKRKRLSCAWCGAEETAEMWGRVLVRKVVKP